MMSTVQTSDLNQQNIQLLVEMGYDFDVIVKAMRGIREKGKFNPVGEVQRVIEWINDYSFQQEVEQIKLLQDVNRIQQTSQNYEQEVKVKNESLG